MGHVLCAGYNKISQAIEWEPVGTRRGRPKLTYVGTMWEAAGNG